ncbi:flagellar biosynthesis protein FlhB [Candidatus Poribacteria bacterium]|nr:flagellar biosynthesis protein FlhB [Candidatus Poribacteria bacterium]
MPETTDKEERTESATPRRREEARKKGQVAKSQDLTSAFMFLIGLVVVRYAFPAILSELADITRYWSFDSRYLIRDGGNSIIRHMMSNTGHLALVLAPYGLIMIASALLINYVQVGFLISGEALTPKLERLDPIKGMTRLFSKRTLVAFTQSLLKIIVVGYMLYITMMGEKDAIMGLADMPMKIGISQIARIMFKMGIRAAFLLFGLGLVDYAYQRWEYEQSIKMTKQEVKEELKQSEGDPLVKSRIRSIQREMTMSRMMSEIPDADVVITNPTHLAVALKYDIEKDSAPRVCAKGKRLIAERMKEIAREHNIPIIEDKPLAQELYKLKLDQEIPTILYQAVAEILSRIYNMRDNG